jgi:hypothetical protein
MPEDKALLYWRRHERERGKMIVYIQCGVIFHRSCVRGRQRCPYRGRRISGSSPFGGRWIERCPYIGRRTVVSYRGRRIQWCPLRPANSVVSIQRPVDTLCCPCIGWRIQWCPAVLISTTFELNLWNRQLHVCIRPWSTCAKNLRIVGFIPTNIASKLSCFLLNDEFEASALVAEWRWWTPLSQPLHWLFQETVPDPPWAVSGDYDRGADKYTLYYC